MRMMRIMVSACAEGGDIYGDVLGWVGVNYGHLGTFHLPTTISLRSVEWMSPLTQGKIVGTAPRGDSAVG